MPDRLTFVGHATVLAQLAGRRVLTDPVLRDRIAHLRRVAPPVPSGVTRDLDAVLISHQHLDHLDMPSLRRLDRSVTVVVPRAAERRVRGLGFRHVHALAPGETVSLAGLEVTAVPADHDGRRLPRGPRQAAVGYVLAAGSQRIYFAGDTDLHEGMADLGAPDVALLPVWGWGTSLGTGHLTPERAVDALALIRPRIAVPIHWGTLRPIGRARAMRTLLAEPPRRFAALAARRVPGVRVEVLPPGGSLTLG